MMWPFFFLKKKIIWNFSVNFIYCWGVLQVQKCSADLLPVHSGLLYKKPQIIFHFFVFIAAFGFCKYVIR
ncbi:hypothetical protein QBC38DRAFT_87087 [Podospora fimiseda]|uniref:Uncharacterized protein n=1 Tax=Podospora fimiseda TaxID=252190 RepID=A0AAN6YN56_9PEZI|nr:hypothetical protein QBC38DRAFT_87087 [Podospora fimiseda]